MLTADTPAPLPAAAEAPPAIAAEIAATSALMELVAVAVWLNVPVTLRLEPVT